MSWRPCGKRRRLTPQHGERTRQMQDVCVLKPSSNRPRPASQGTCHCSLGDDVVLWPSGTSGSSFGHATRSAHIMLCSCASYGTPVRRCTHTYGLHNCRGSALFRTLYPPAPAAGNTFCFSLSAVPIPATEESGRSDPWRPYSCRTALSAPLMLHQDTPHASVI